MIADALTLGQERLRALVELGGPVVAIRLGLSVVVVAVLLYKLVQFRAEGLGRHRTSRRALAAWASGRGDEAPRLLAHRQTHLSGLMAEAIGARRAGAPEATLRERLAVRTETGFGRLESRFRLLDVIAQLAPLLGLFGTVLGMIDAFRALQEAGAQVDPTVLAGGIWVALMTTAVGLAVAMPT